MNIYILPKISPYDFFSCPVDCKEKLKSSLFSIEAMGANDYLIAMLRGKTIEELKKMDLVSQVIKANEEGVRVS